MNKRTTIYRLLQFYFFSTCQSFSPSLLAPKITKQGRNSSLGPPPYFLLQGEKQTGDHFCSEDTTSLLRLTLSMTISQVLHAAVDMGLFDILLQQQQESSSKTVLFSIKDLAHAANCRRPDDLLRILRLLAVYDIVQEQPSHDNSQESPTLPCFRLSRLGVCLAQGTAAAMPGHSMVKYILDDALWMAWTKIPEASSLAADQMSAFELANHQTAADYYGANPQALQHANVFVRHISDWEMETCANANSIWESARRVVDLGGYQGRVLEAVQQKHPHLDCICLDLPDVVDQQRGKHQKSPGCKVQLVGGDMFDPSTIPACDTIFMKHIILCEFDAQDSKGILQSCYTVLPPGGRVIIAEAVLPDHPSKKNSLPYQVDVFMMLAGRDRSLKEMEWSDFVGGSGFQMERVVFTDCPTCSFVVLQR